MNSLNKPVSKSDHSLLRIIRMRFGIDTSEI